MNYLTGISFNGIDRKTDLSRIEKVQRMFPAAEFGVILSKNWQENGNRYFNPANLKFLSNFELNLSAHLCGSIAREAAVDNWEPAVNLCGGAFWLFKRVQLNIAPYPPIKLGNPKTGHFDNVPANINEIIIQQKTPAEASSYLEYKKNNEDKRVVILLDASGGLGVESSFKAAYGLGKVGYAGGLNPYNIVKHTLSVKNDGGGVTLRNGMNGMLNGNTPEYTQGPVPYHNFWMDMESGVRTDDWFDIDKVISVCGQVYGALGITPKE